MPPRKRRTEEPDVSTHGSTSQMSKKQKAKSPEIDYDKLAEAIMRKQANENDKNCDIRNVQGHAGSEMPTHDDATRTPGATMASVQQPAQPSTSSSNAVFNDFPSFLQNFFLGESLASSQQTDCQPLSLNDGIPLGANIPLRVKQKIWADHYVDLKTLLPNFKESTVSIQIEQNSLSFSNTQKSQNSLTIDQWTSAYIT